MTDQEKPPLRDKDRVVLHHIQEGRDDVQKITEATTLENHEVNYCFQKLEELGLIEVEKPDGMVERVVDGQKRVFKAPKKAKMASEKVEQHLDESDEVDRCIILSREELSHRVCELEQDIDELQQSLRIIKKQIQDAL
jgi:predicted transcriptional regulator